MLIPVVEGQIPGLDRDLLGKTIGSSECAIAAGLSPFKSRLEFWGQLMGIVPPFEGNGYTEIGTLLEGDILGWASHELGLEVRRPGSHVPEGYPWVRDTPDGDVYRDGKRIATLDAKVAFPGSFDKWSDEVDGIPDYYICQMQWHCRWQEVEVCYVPVWIIPPHGEPIKRIYTVRYHEQLARDLVEVNQEFWERFVLGQMRPPVDGTESSRRFLAARFPRNDGTMVLADGDMEDLARRYDELRAQAKEIEREQDAVANQLREAIGDADGFLTPDGLVKATWKLERGKVSYKSVCEALAVAADVLEEHRAAGSRVLRVNVKE